MASKILPEAVKRAIRRNFMRRKPKVKSHIPLAARRYFAEQGSIGGKKAARNPKAAKAAGEARIRKLCKEMGVNYDTLPDAPVKPTKTQP